MILLVNNATLMEKLCCNIAVNGSNEGEGECHYGLVEGHTSYVYDKVV